MAEKKKYAKIIKTVFITGLAFAVNYLITLLLTPYITENVGTEAYGFVSLAKNIAQYATYATIALNSFAVRFISVEYHKKEYEKANTYFSSTFFGDVGLASIILAILLAGVYYVEKLFNIPEGLLKDIQLLFILVFLKFWLVTVASAFQTGAFIADKLDLTGIFKGLSYVVEAVFLLLFFRIFRHNVFVVGIGLLAGGLTVCLSDYWITKRYTPHLRIDKADYRFSAVRELVVSGVWSSINSMGSFLHSGLDLIICNIMLTPLEMGQLAIAQSVDLIFKSLDILVSKAFQPAFLKSYAEKNSKKLYQDFDLACIFSGMIANIMFAGFSALGLAYLKLWIPKQDTDFIYYLCIMTMIPSATTGIVYPIYYVYSLTVRKKIPCFFTLISGAMNVIGMYVLIKYFDLGIHAVVWTTVVLMTAVNFIAHPLYAAHCLGRKWTAFYLVILKNVLSGTVLFFLFRWMASLYMPDTWGTLFGTALVYAAVGAVVHAILTAPRQTLFLAKKLANR